jgi:PilZ domain
MSSLDSIRKFEYRPFRMRIGFDVDFEVEGMTLHGSCRDVSDAGIRVEFYGAVVVGSSGVLTLHYLKHYPTSGLSVEAHVAYVEKYQVGLVFLFKTQCQRDLTMDFITTIANLTAAPIVVRFP